MSHKPGCPFHPSNWREVGRQVDSHEYECVCAKSSYRTTHKPGGKLRSLPPFPENTW